MDANSYLNQILMFANENPVCHLATVDGDQPRVRGMMMWFADESGFYFHTGSVKNLASQIQNGAKAEIAFLKATENPGESAAMRACGKVEILNDPQLYQRLLQERTWLNDLEAVAPDSKLIIFKICNGEAFLWDMSKNLQEHRIPRAQF